MMASIQSQKEIRGWQKAETRVDCPIVYLRSHTFGSLSLVSVSVRSAVGHLNYFMQPDFYKRLKSETKNKTV